MGHVQEYMDMLKEEDPERYKFQFAKFIEGGKEDDVEQMYKDCHEAIRADPKFVKKEASGITNTHAGNKVTTSKGTEYVRMAKLSLEQRRAKVAQKKASAGAKLMKAMAEDEEEE